MAPSFVPLSPSGAVVDPLQNTCHPDQILFLNLSVVKLMYQLTESSVAPGSMQISPRDLALGQGESVRSSLENSNPTTVRRRIVGKRTVSSPCTFGFIR